VKTVPALLLLSLPLLGQAPEHEIPPVFQSVERLPAELLAGPHHRVRPMAPSDGYLTHYTVDSDFGVYDCAGRRELERRLVEIAAIAKLVKVSRSDLFAEGLRRSVEEPVEAVKHIVREPEETVRQLPKTVGHFFSKVGSSIGNTARRVGRSVDEGAAPDAGEVGRGIGEAAKSVAGFDRAKLDTARQLGVDPYTDNRRLREEIEKVSWAFFAGGLPLRIGAIAASGGASTALTATKAAGLPEDVYELTPSELALRDRRALEAYGVAEGTIDALLSRPGLSVSQRHRLVLLMGRLPGGPWRGELVVAALGVERPRQLVFLNDALERLAARHEAAGYREVKLFGRLPAGVTDAGWVEVVAPVDFVSWTEEVAGFARRADFIGERRLVTGAGFSPAARAGFAQAGWVLEKGM